MSGLKRMFAGGNSSQGFFSFYDGITSGEARRLYILKGGPGTGKSTLMKSVAEQLQEHGFELEIFHCSSDVDSWDAIAIPSLKAAIVDGTAPHVIEPKFPGCVERLINFNDYLSNELVSKNQAQIKELVAAKSQAYPRVYRLLKAANLIYQDIQTINESYMNFGKVNQLVGNLIKEVFSDLPASSQLGKTRHLFASAITPQGYVNKLPSIVNHYQKKIVLQGQPGTGTSYLIDRVANYAAERGLDTDLFHCPLDPKRLEHLTIAALDVAVITLQAPYHFQIEAGITVNLDEFLNQDKRQFSEELLQKDQALLDDLLEQVFVQLQLTKNLHDQLEALYVPAMDFAKLDQQRDQILEELLALAAE